MFVQQVRQNLDNTEFGMHGKISKITHFCLLVLSSTEFSTTLTIKVTETRFYCVAHKTC